MKVYLESKAQVEALIGQAVGKLEIFDGNWFTVDEHIFIGDENVSETNCVAMEIAHTVHMSDEICVFMCDDYVSESLKAVVVMTDKEIEQ